MNQIVICLITKIKDTPTLDESGISPTRSTTHNQQSVLCLICTNFLSWCTDEATKLFHSSLNLGTKTSPLVNIFFACSVDHRGISHLGSKHDIKPLSS